MSLLILFLWAFFEAILFPIPPDVYLLVLAMDEGFFLPSLVASIGSFLGSIFGYYFGFYLRDFVKGFLEGKLEKVESLYRELGDWAIPISAVSPIPFKVFVLSSGFLRYPFDRFLLLSFPFRTLRFFLVSYLSYSYGKNVISFLIDNPILTLLSIALLSAGFLITYLKSKK